MERKREREGYRERETDRERDRGIERERIKSCYRIMREKHGVEKETI